MEAGNHAAGALGALGLAVLLLRRYKRQHREISSKATENPATDATVKPIEAPDEKAEKTAAAVAATTSSPSKLPASWAAQAVQAAKDAMASRGEKTNEDGNNGGTAAVMQLTPPAAATGYSQNEAEQVMQATNSSQEMIREYIVDNSHLQASTPGLGYRRTKSSSARVENAWEPWGKVVKGVDEGDWLRVGQLFLPKSLGGFAVLHSKGSKKRVAKNGAAPQYVDCLMTWPTCSDFAALEAESSHCSASSSVRSTGEASAHEAPRKIPISEVCSAVAMAAACPSHGWQYLDQTGSVQGPFSLDEMRHWNRKGYFRADLLMRCHPEDSFVALAALFPAPLVPFQSHPKRPRRAPRSHESPR